MSGAGLAVDFGTSATVAMVRTADGRVRPLVVDGSPLLPSAVYAGPDGLVVGADALHLGAQDPARLELQPKLRIDDGEVLLGERAYPVVDLVAAVLRRVVGEARRALGTVPPAVLTYPAGWGEARCQVLTAAAAAAGLPEVTLVSEPVAAAALFAPRTADRRPIAVFDLGAGTCDVAVLRHGGTGWTLAGHSGLTDLGGADVDAVLVEHLARTVVHPSWRALRQPADDTQRRAAHELWTSARAAKENLSTMDATRLRVPGVPDAVPLSRSDLEKLARPLAERAAYATGEALRAAGVEPAELGALYLVGGGSRMPLFGAVLAANLGVTPRRLEQPELAVAEGALAVAAAPAPPAPPPPPVPAAEAKPGGARRWVVAVAAAIVVLAVAAAAVVWWGNEDEPAAVPKPRPLDTSIRGFDFRNAEWKGSGGTDDNEKFRLRDGLHGDFNGPDGGYKLTGGALYADIDGDGDEDAAVELTWRSGGSIWAAVWYAWTWDGTTAVQRDSFAGSGRLVTVDSVTATPEGFHVKEREKTIEDPGSDAGVVPKEYTVAIRDGHVVRVAPRLAPLRTCDRNTEKGREVTPTGPVTVRAAPAPDGPVIVKDKPFRSVTLIELPDESAFPGGWQLAMFDDGKELMCGWAKKADLE